MDLFATVNFNNFILIDVFEDVRRIHENANGAGGGNNEKYIKLQTIDDHCHVFPIFTSLKSKCKKKKKKNTFNELPNSDG